MKVDISEPPMFSHLVFQYLVKSFIKHLLSLNIVYLASIFNKLSIQR